MTKKKQYFITVMADFRQYYDKRCCKMIFDEVKSDLSNKILCYDSYGNMVCEYNREHITIKEIYG